jgi:ATP-dependent helicase/nuclease subunit A
MRQRWSTRTYLTTTTSSKWLSLLEDAPAIREQLREEFDFVMVDEVQDTDPRQWELVQLLTSEDVDTYGGDNMFLVGDGK